MATVNISTSAQLAIVTFTSYKKLYKYSPSTHHFW